MKRKEIPGLHTPDFPASVLTQIRILCQCSNKKRIDNINKPKLLSYLGIIASFGLATTINLPMKQVNITSYVDNNAQRKLLISPYFYS